MALVVIEVYILNKMILLIFIML